MWSLQITTTNAPILAEMNKADAVNALLKSSTRSQSSKSLYLDYD